MPEHSEKENIVVRFAPSPTGFFHVGSARTALFNEFFARQHGGKFILRIEDTDEMRNEKRFEESILNGLKWLGVSYDEFYRQSERKDIYKKYLGKLVEEDKAYVSKEEQGERSEVIRFRNPGTEIIFSDMIRGEVKMHTGDLGDFVIAKDFESPLYHFAVSVDDFEMGITHVIRGEDGISNTPRQILIQEALGASRPTYAHIPLILAPDRSKLSKRHGAVSIDEYRELGYLSEAMINFLAFLGWNPGGEQEIFSKEEIIQTFDLSRVQKGGAIFNLEKLNWFNKAYLKKLPQDALGAQVESILSEYYDAAIVKKSIAKFTPILLERISVMEDLRKMVADGEVAYYFLPPEYETDMLINPKEKKQAQNEEDLSMLREKTKKNIDEIVNLLQKNFPEEGSEAAFSSERIKEIIWKFAEQEGKGSVLWPMRFALSGREKSVDPFTLAEILGQKETLSRLREASQKLEKKL
ncbi:MAG TPA: glutamate--tRNA ligase family protein [Candidatus Paceibacterota bacterium]|nr:glutamate--tRNA ligase family protein [Candidatus Paceibacterota bacterium]